MPNGTYNEVIIRKNGSASITDKFMEKFMEEKEVSVAKISGFDPNKYPYADMANIHLIRKPLEDGKQVAIYQHVPADRDQENILTLFHTRHEEDKDIRRENLGKLLLQIGKGYTVDDHCTLEFLVELKDYVKKRFNGNPFSGYDWNVKHLGVKGEFEIQDLYEQDDMLEFTCETAWGHPSAFLQAISNELGVEVECNYDIEGEDYNHDKTCFFHKDNYDEDKDDGTQDCPDDLCRPQIFTEKYYPTNAERMRQQVYGFIETLGVDMSQFTKKKGKK